jgi:lipopolysaccharide export LptBFGC system permease protein LptF
VGCLIFGICWTIVFGLTNYVLALGDPVDPTALNPVSVAFWVEIAVLVVAGWLFYRAEMRGGEF